MLFGLAAAFPTSLAIVGHFLAIFVGHLIHLSMYLDLSWRAMWLVVLSTFGRTEQRARYEMRAVGLTVTTTR
ncbi:MAG: hypothetical protein OXE79_02245 [Acidimicrobiaceae bacterium]|nr:hypothetical protein [Acidimicrobiaceae bacterium]MCY4175269.1 hypothetical protein [Acidimicrobiaceae bacterium]MCY4279223.1 hypothetical protein [Acidimicrobiaceae bacterium]MCY4293753.1 hypothetical protein [Acidimicrobiaceae bacterium]